MTTAPPHRRHVSSHDLASELSGRLVQSSSLLFELGQWVVPFVVGLVLIHSLLATVQVVDGPSMLPTFTSGSAVLVDRRDWQDYVVGDVIVLRYPGDPEHRQYLKRIVAGPGDRIQISQGRVWVGGTPLAEGYLPAGTLTLPDVPAQTLADNEYYTIGDNRAVSNDSRFYGPIERRYLYGRVIATLARNAAR